MGRLGARVDNTRKASTKRPPCLLEKELSGLHGVGRAECGSQNEEQGKKSRVFRRYELI